jgi:hypothetical protein
VLGLKRTHLVLQVRLLSTQLWPLLLTRNWVLLLTSGGRRLLLTLGEQLLSQKVAVGLLVLLWRSVRNTVVRQARRLHRAQLRC